MGKDKKNKNKKRNDEFEVKTFEDALMLILSNTVPVEAGEISVVKIEPVKEGDSEMNEYEREREKIFSLMSVDELESYDEIDNFINSGPIVLPENPDSLESQLEHAEWNNEEYRMRLTRLLADLEASVAYYITLKNSTQRIDSASKELEKIQSCLDKIKLYGWELGLLRRITEAEFNMNQASVRLNEAIDESDTLRRQLAYVYSEIQKVENNKKDQRVSSSTDFILVNKPDGLKEN